MFIKWAENNEKKNTGVNEGEKVQGGFLRAEHVLFI